MIFKMLSKEEFERLTIEERMDYLRRLQADLHQKMEESRQLIAGSKRVTRPE